MSYSRRQSISIIGGGLVVAASASGGYLLTQKPDSATQPWKLAGSYEDIRLKILSFALLAPNPHNRQPWKVELTSQNMITLYVDTKRLLPHTDPLNRQITIGLGCFLEILRLAALEYGYETSIAAFPLGSNPIKLDERPVAVITLKKSSEVQKDPLFKEALYRRSNKTPYDTARPILTETLTALQTSVLYGSNVQTTNEVKKITQLRKLSLEAFLREVNVDHTYKESVDLFRIGAREVNASPDGISFTGPLFEGLHLTGQFTREIALDKNASAFKSAIGKFEKTMNSAMGYIWLSGKTNSREEQLKIGYDWVRINLKATQLGLAMQPLSQALQEYPEMKDYFEQIHTLLAPKGETLQMLARLGYSSPIEPSPRWPVGAKVIGKNT